MKYRKKPVVIEAFQFYVDNMPDWFMDAVSNDEVILYNCDYKRYTIDEAYCRIHTLEGWRWCNGGDYVIKGIKGELYPCKADIFKQTYEEVKQMTKIEEIEQKVKELSEEIEQLKNQEKVAYSRFIPEIGDKYWYVSSMGMIYNCNFENNIFEQYKIANSPVFRTEEEAKRYLEFKQELTKRRWLVTEEEWEDDEVDKLVIYYDYTRKEFGVTCTWVCKYLGEIYFKDKESAQYIIDNFKEELMEFIF